MSEIAAVLYVILICGFMEIVWARHESKESRADFFVFCLTSSIKPKEVGWTEWFKITVFLVFAFPLFVFVAITHHKEMKQAYEQTRKTKAGWK